MKLLRKIIIQGRSCDKDRWRFVWKGFDLIRKLLDR